MADLHPIERLVEVARDHLEIDYDGDEAHVRSDSIEAAVRAIFAALHPSNETTAEPVGYLVQGFDGQPFYAPDREQYDRQGHVVIPVYARPPKQVDDGWHIVETAPRDSRWVWLWNKHCDNPERAAQRYRWSTHYSVFGLSGCWTDGLSTMGDRIDFDFWRETLPAGYVPPPVVCSDTPPAAAPASSSIADRARDLIAKMTGFEIEKVTDVASWGDLGCDSLDVVELVMAFEEEFGIEIPDEDAEDILLVKDAIRYIERAKGGA